MPIARLEDRAVLAVSGADAPTFLQNLITNDVTRLTPGTAVYAALLAPQGKILVDFLVVRDGPGDRFLIDVAAPYADGLLKRLAMYRLRAAVELTDLRDSHVVLAGWDDDGLSGNVARALAYDDPRLPALGVRWIASAADAPTTGLAERGAYETRRLALGIPDTGDLIGQFLLDANGEELNAVDFRKGCFVGQEVTARMKHKAAPRRRMLPVDIDGAVPPAGTPLVDQAGTEIGELAGGAHGRAMATIRVDRLTPGAKLTAAGRPATLRPAAYALPVALPS